MSTKIKSMLKANAISKKNQQSIKGGIGYCYHECAINGYIGTLSSCRANCSGSFCYRICS